MTDFLPPQAPDADEPSRGGRPVRSDGGDRARMVVAAKVGRARRSLQAGEHPPRNGHALWSLGVAVGGARAAAS